MKAPAQGAREREMKVPNRITPAYLESKGYELREVYADGLRTVLVTKVGRKHVKAYCFKQFLNKSSSLWRPIKLTLHEYHRARKYQFIKRKWRIAA